MIPALDESKFQELAAEAFRRISDALEAVDPDVVDYDSAGDVVTLTLRRTRRCVLNTQRAIRQIWLAASARAWHFSWDPGTGMWLDDKGRGEELFDTVARVVESESGAKITYD
jgi:CyaY protein